MTSITLNQTESEKRLNRILYYVKVLRASILGFILTFLAFGLYMAFGITALYPEISRAIDSARATLDSNTIAVLVISIFLLAVGFSVWLYMSITRVWRKSLKAQSIFGVILILFYPFALALQFPFSYNHLDPLFTVLF